MRLFPLRLLDSLLPAAPTDSLARRVESCPPVARAWLDGWPGERPGARRRRGEALAAARLDFAEALFDVRSAASIDVQGRIAVARSLHALWHFREEVFSLIARRHDQAEAARRMEALNRHFQRRSTAGPARR